MARGAAKTRPERRRPGRPTTFTYETGEKIVGLVRDGNYVEVAAQAAGIPKSRLYDWLGRAAEFDDASPEELEALDDEMMMFVWFRDAYKVAEAEAEVEMLGVVRAAESHWQATMTVMQRRFGMRWREKTDVEVSGEVGVKSSPLEPEKVAEELEAFGMPAATHVAAGPDSVPPPADA